MQEFIGYLFIFIIFFLINQGIQSLASKKYNLPRVWRLLPKRFSFSLVHEYFPNEQLKYANKKEVTIRIYALDLFLFTLPITITKYNSFKN